MLDQEHHRGCECRGACRLQSLTATLRRCHAPWSEFVSGPAGGSMVRISGWAAWMRDSDCHRYAHPLPQISVGRPRCVGGQDEGRTVLIGSSTVACTMPAMKLAPAARHGSPLSASWCDEAKCCNLGLLVSSGGRMSRGGGAFRPRSPPPHDLRSLNTLARVRSHHPSVPCTTLSTPP